MKISLSCIRMLGVCFIVALQPMHAAISDTSQVSHADYVVVGMGASGAGVAKLLSNDLQTSVIGIEAGKNQDNDKPIKDSTEAFDLQFTHYAAYFYQQDQLPEAFNGEQFNYTTGYLWGGGSSINRELYVQGTNKNYKRWEELLGATWSVEKIRKTFKEIEKYNGRTSNPKARGFHGAVDIRQTPKHPTIMAQKFVRAITSATGFPKIFDYNNPKTPIGPFTRWQLYQKPNGRRESSSTAYLEGIVGKNGKAFGKRKLTILSKASVGRILFDENKRAIGVEFVKKGKTCTAFAAKKVILCAGIFSPKLLMLSGVGPKKLLKSKGVDVVFDNPNVGKSLINHPIISTRFKANPEDRALPANDPNALYVGGAFLPNPTPGSSQSQRDVQFLGMSPHRGSFVVLAFLIHPKSRGYLKIQSNDPLKPVLTTDAILSNPDDLKAFKNIFKVYIKNIAKKLHAIDPRYKLVEPTLATINNDHLLTKFIKENVGVSHHWVTSCRMAPRSHGGVVNKYGHVYGVKNLVIADASIAPYINDGNTSAPAFMIGRMIAKQLIKADRKK